jgi:hypothetical protein
MLSRNVMALRVVPTLILSLALLAAPLAAEAQPAKGVHRIGLLGNSTPALEANLVGPFREGLRQLGYVEGQGPICFGIASRAACSTDGI